MRIRSSFVNSPQPTIGGASHSLPDSEDDGHSKLVAAVQAAPPREWITTFLDHLADLITIWGFDADDPRVVTTIRDGTDFAISVGSRYALKSYPQTEEVGFILSANTEDLEHLLEEGSATVAFEALSGEDPTRTPHWVRYPGIGEQLREPAVRQGWLAEVGRSVDRGDVSPYRRHHEPVVFRAAVDGAYREQVLEEALGQ